MNFEAALISESGPRNINEDAAAFWSPAEGTLIAAVADGLGGMGGGSDASRIAISTLKSLLSNGSLNPAGLLSAIRQAHANIITAQQTSIALKNMATTLTAAIFTDSKLTGAHCGDSRASIARAKGIKRLTTDHTEGERLFRAGKLTKEELFTYPRKNILDTALGAHDAPRIDAFEFNIATGDRVFFTTDGTHNKIPLRHMRTISEKHLDVHNFMDDLKLNILNRSPDDNFSAIAVFVI